MSGGLNRRFLQNPAEFLKKNLVLQDRFDGRFGRRINPFIGDFTFKPAKTYDGGPQTAVKLLETGEYQPIPVVELDRYDNSGARRHSHPIKAHYLPYMSGRVLCASLTGDPKFMFTHSLSGCQFGIGGNGHRGDVKVMHIAAGLTEDQKGRLARDHLGNLCRFYIREFYSSLGNANIFGFKTGSNEWQFQAQAYEQRAMHEQRLQHEQRAEASNPRRHNVPDVDYICQYTDQQV